MASNYPLYKITYTFAQNGNKKIPPATASAAGTGRFSQAKGFDQINSKPLNQGGIPPYREDFNGAFYLRPLFGCVMSRSAIRFYSLPFCPAIAFKSSGSICGFGASSLI